MLEMPSRHSWFGGDREKIGPMIQTDYQYKTPIADIKFKAKTQRGLVVTDRT